MRCPIVRRLLLLILCVAATRSAAAENAADGRAVLDLNFDWRFIQTDVSGGEAEAIDDSPWRRIDLPHDWSIEGEYSQDAPAGGAGAYLPAGIGWYRREIDVPAEWVGKRLFIEIDAAQRNSDVWINGQHLGHRPYGYISFGYDLTPHIKPGRNVIAVRLDNSQVPAARWYTGSGIYSHVRLIVTDKVHIPQWGTFITTPHVSGEHGEIAVSTEIANDSDRPAEVVLATQVLDGDGEVVAASESRASLAAGARDTVDQRMQVDSPRLWSPDSPYLYRVVQTLRSESSETLDETRTNMGFRTIRFDADSGFWLNGENIKLKGVGIHYDAGPMGVAIPGEILERRLMLLKAMGANAVRTGHTPFPPTFYDICDRIGLLVMNEAFDGWRRKVRHDYGAQAFEQWWRRDLSDMVRRDRNHPCVFMWSIGNETGHEDRYGMRDVIRALDPTRPTTGGQVLHGVDVAGFNGPAESPGVLENFRREHPDQPIVLTEAPHGYQTRGFYRTLTWWRDDNPERRFPFPPYSTEEIFKYGGDPQYNSSYDNATVRITSRQHWRRTRDTPWISGEFRWAGIDYLGEGHFNNRRWPARYWHPGLHDTAGFPKDTAFFYRSQWTREPMVHLLPHWTHPLVEHGVKIPVVAYSNCDEVELFLNGRSLGRQKPREDLLDFVWQVPHEPGEIRAVAYRGGSEAATTRFRTAGAPYRIKLEMDEPELTSKRGDVAMVTFSIIDDAGEMVPWAHDRIEFALSGPAQLLGYDNGNNVDVTPHRVPYRSVFHGLGRGFFRATGEDGSVELTAAAVLGNRLFQEKTTVAMDVQRLALRGALAPALFVIHYTLDGSEPTAASPRYHSPIEISSPTRVRMLVLRDGQPFMASGALFEQGMPPIFDDPRYEKTGDDGAGEQFDRKPRDPEVVGLWSDGRRRLEFTPEGSVLRHDAHERTPVGTWWYDYPNDLFEDPSDNGTGQLHWSNSGQTSQLRLVSRDGRELLILTAGRERKLERVK